MMLLRETGSGPDGFPREPKNMALGDEEAAILRDLFACHPAIGRFRKNAGLSLAHLSLEEVRFVNSRRDSWPGVSEIKGCVALAFWKRKRLHGMVLLHRSPVEGEFSAAEISALRELHAHLESAFCRIMSTRQLGAQKHLLAGIVKSLPLPFVLCDARSKILCETTSGLEGRAVWEFGHESVRSITFPGGRALPPDLGGFCSSRMKTWENAGAAQRRKIEQEKIPLRHPHSPGLQVEVRMLRPKGFPLVKPFFLFQFARLPDAMPRMSLDSGEHQLAWLSLLSSREREIAQLVCAGHGNAAISRYLRKSIHTVKAQLHSIFRKLNVRGRGSLMAMALRAPQDGLPSSRRKSGTSPRVPGSRKPSPLAAS